MEMGSHVLKGKSCRDSAVTYSLLGQHQNGGQLKNLGQLRLFFDRTQFEIFKIDGFKIRQIEENLSKNVVDELLVLIILSNNNSVI